jgi:hypothetical protein
MTAPPIASATGVHSPLGSHGTYALWPRATDLVISAFAVDDLPLPITPASSTFGFVMTLPW